MIGNSVSDFVKHSLPLIIVVVCALILPRLAWRPLGALERLLLSPARSRVGAVAAAFFIGLSACLALALYVGIPQPAVHDEFSYLLAADTFAHGRLTNPPHPMWVHFESFHILQQPTYTSKYPPGQGLVLAFGQVLSGQPILGVWLSTAAAVAAICWMLLAWMPPRWSLLGGWLAAFNPTFLEWSQCYWGGAVAVAGGALVLGAVRRLAETPNRRNALLLGLGLVILANSRPYEGLVLAVSALTALVLWWRYRRPFPRGAILRQVAAPAGLVLGLAGLWMGYYNWRVTGNAFLMPYALHEATYAARPQFLWQRPGPEPVYHHKVMRDFYTGTATRLYDEQRTWKGFVASAPGKLLVPEAFLRPIMLAAPLIALPWMLRRDWWIRAAVAILVLTDLAVLGAKALFPHYAAPLAPLVLLLLVVAIRTVRTARLPGRPIGRQFARGVLLIFVFSLANWLWTFGHFNRDTWWMWRAHLIADLERQGGKHLILVHYRPGHELDHEWVYNRADIDHASVVWAREMDPANDGPLLAYFRDRRAWRLDADARKPELIPLPRDLHGVPPPSR